MNIFAGTDGEEGQALVEYAVVAPIVLLVLLFVLQVVILAANKVIVANAAFDVARAAAVSDQDDKSDSRSELIDLARRRLEASLASDVSRTGDLRLTVSKRGREVVAVLVMRQTPLPIVRQFLTSVGALPYFNLSTSGAVPAGQPWE